MDQQPSANKPAINPLNRSRVERWSVPELEVVQHQQLGQEWIPHWHAQWSIGAIIHGQCHCSIGGRSVIGNTGDLIAIAPQTIHTGTLTSPAQVQPVRVIMLYVPPQWFAKSGISAPNTNGFTHLPDIALAAQALQTPSDVEPWLRRAAAALQQPLAKLTKDAVPTPAAKRVLAAFQKGFSLEGASCIADLAQRCNISREQLHRVIRRWTGMSPTHYLRALRVNQAREMLLNGQKPAEVASACGFSDQAHLTRLFKSSFGYTPGDLIAALDKQANTGQAQTNGP